MSKIAAWFVGTILGLTLVSKTKAIGLAAVLAYPWLILLIGYLCKTY